MKSKIFLSLNKHLGQCKHTSQQNICNKDRVAFRHFNDEIVNMVSLNGRTDAVSAKLAKS